MNIGVARYNRVPTRYKLHLAWILVGGTFFVHQVLHLTVFRVQPKREEQIYTMLNKKYPDGNIPKEILDQVQQLREMREGLSLHTTLATPTPGQYQAIMVKDCDVTRLGELRKA